MSDKSSEESDFVSVEVEASSHMRTLALPAVPGERVAAAIARAARRAGLSFSRARAIWYGEARALLATEMDQLRAAAARFAEGQAQHARREIAELGTELDQLERRIAETRAKIARAMADDAVA